jgi:hypothetical protein
MRFVGWTSAHCDFVPLWPTEHCLQHPLRRSEYTRPAAFALGTVRHLLLANGGGAFRQARACYAALALDVSHLQVRLLEVEEVRCHSCTA